MATVILKPTEACNASCIYCIVPKQRRGPLAMPLETLELFFFRVDEFLRERPREQLEIVWHGGEPLLLGPNYFSQAIHFQEKHCPETGSRIRHSLQSNLTLFSQEFSGILKKLGITSLGTSYEPIENLRGLGSKRDSRAYNRKFMEAVGLLEEEGFEWGIIYVVNKLSLGKPLELFQFFANLVPGGNFMFNPVLLRDRRLHHLKITPEEYAGFLGAIFPAWWRQREDLPRVEPFAALIRNLQGDTRSLFCGDSGACADSHLSLFPDGSLSLCGRSGDWGLLPFGSIREKSFSQVMADPLRDQLRERRQILPETDCRECRFWPFCHGGCPLEACAATGSFLRKSDWCAAKKDFIEKYVEPAMHSASGNAAAAETQPQLSTPGAGIIQTARESAAHNSIPWINPRGGSGEALMLAGVLKQVVEQSPSRKFNLVSRAHFETLLEGHPALDRIGHPPPGARLIDTDYWNHETYQLPGKRAYQALAELFCLKPPVPEQLYLPGETQDDPVLLGLIPWQPVNILICPGSRRPQKQMAVARWESLVARWRQEGLGVVQAGIIKDRYVRGAYSLLGLNTLRQLIALVRHFDAIITVDNFSRHAAYLSGVPAVVLWGPTDHQCSGYAGQINLQAKFDCGDFGKCLGNESGNREDCTRGVPRCLDQLEAEDIYQAVRSLIQNKQPRPT